MSKPGSLRELNFIQAVEDPKIMRSLFGEDLSSWRAWLTLARAVFGLPMDDQALSLFRACTERNAAPSKQFREVFIASGRRSGKSFFVALLSVFIALFYDLQSFLGNGERAVVLILSVDKAQCQIIMNFIRAILSIPIFKKFVKKEKAEKIELINSVDIEVHSSNYRSIRGRAVAVGIMEELCFWLDENYSNPATEVYRSLKPSLAQFPNSLLLGISSPYSRSGLLYQKYKQYYGVEDSETLFWQSGTRIMNPTIPAALIEKELVLDPASARSEYLGLWRDDVESYVSAEAIWNCTIHGRTVLPPAPGLQYFGFADVSGGGADSYSIAIAHLAESGKVVIDRLEADRGDPFALTERYAEVFRRYALTTIGGDKYAAEWPVSTFARLGITFEHCEKNKSQLYLETLPLINSGGIELLDHPEMAAQFQALERRKSGGKDIIDHPSYGRSICHDDLSNSAAGVALRVLEAARGPTCWELPYATSSGMTPGIGAGRRSEGDLWLATEIATRNEYERRKHFRVGD